MTGGDIPVSRVEWEGAVRIIRSAFPPVDLFEDIADPADWPLLISAEQKTNPRVMASIGNLDLVPVDDDVDRALDARQVTDALASLSVDHRQVLIETYYRGRSVAEAATALGVPPGTVKSRTYYALRALRLVLEERGVTEP